jgi:hypothetical protein
MPKPTPSVLAQDGARRSHVVKNPRRMEYFTYI